MVAKEERYPNCYARDNERSAGDVNNPEDIDFGELIKEIVIEAGEKVIQSEWGLPNSGKRLHIAIDALMKAINDLIEKSKGNEPK